MVNLLSHRTAFGRRWTPTLIDRFPQRQVAAAPHSGHVFR